MKKIFYTIVLLTIVLLSSCSKEIYESNGESIYKAGINLQGEKMLNKSASRITIVNSCKTCHGKDGDSMSGISIKYSYLSNPENFKIPYNDSLVYRFLDQDLKSDGTKANIGVIWKMSDRDKADLVAYLKTL